MIPKISNKNSPCVGALFHLALTSSALLLVSDWFKKKKKERHHQGAQLSAAFERCDTSYMFPTPLCLWQALEVQSWLRSEECVRGPGSHVLRWMIHRVVYAGNWLVERKKNVMIRGETLWRSNTAGLRELNAPSEQLDPANDCRVQHSMLQSHFL